MKPLTIEIHGTSTYNRGAELMAIAIADRLRATFPGVRLVVPPYFGSRNDIRKYGFFTTWQFHGKRHYVIKTILAYLRWWNDKQVIPISDVDFVLDASGFSFSDQWGAASARALVLKMRSPKRARQALVLLPQALGPFDNPDVRKWSKELFERALVVCARDEISLKNVRPLSSESKLRLYPDFTVGISSMEPDAIDLPAKFAAIVPNMRMLDKTGSAERYLDFLRISADRISASGFTPVFLVHDGAEDRKVIDLLGDSYANYPVVTHPDPRILKGILGKSKFVIGSRFHALVSSLSQGIPCIAAGWSHKYPELLQSFSCQEFLISDLADVQKLEELIGQLTDESQRREVSARVLNAAKSIKERNLTMWNEVEDLIRSTTGR